ncbi:TRAP transporter small permease [Salinarimonas ramus]|uniref:TRAP transporter small permease protein n=1 Tax=Salinarimonas ramus TaxID=690164 RepID=A0A917V8C2_9HYPH|nr:TRAP transporter small permease [Salinarimonas ramus]GGK49135.1 C4-dicarboxylate ABC transporter substrate-binding protein [Salinarimonas ramus]
MITKAVDVTAKALLVFASLLAFSLCFLVVADVVGRSLFSTPVQGTPEIVSSAIVVICYLMATHAVLSGGMMEVTLVTGAVPAPVRAVLVFVACLLGALLFGIIAWGGLDRFVQAWVAGSYEGEGALRVPTWPARLSVFVGSALCCVAYVLIAFRGARDALAGRAIASPPHH